MHSPALILASPAAFPPGGLIGLGAGRRTISISLRSAVRGCTHRHVPGKRVIERKATNKMRTEPCRMFDESKKCRSRRVNEERVTEKEVKQSEGEVDSKRHQV